MVTWFSHVSIPSYWAGSTLNCKMKVPISKTKVTFHHHNTPTNSTAVATANLAELDYELLPHTPYTPDLAPCYVYLFPNMKNSPCKIFRQTG